MTRGRLLMLCILAVLIAYKLQPHADTQGACAAAQAIAGRVPSVCQQALWASIRQAFALVGMVTVCVSGLGVLLLVSKRKG